MSKKAILVVLVVVCAFALAAQVSPTSSPELCVSAHGSGLYPLGELASSIYAAAGGGLGIEVLGLGMSHFDLGFDLEYLDFFPSLTGVSSIQNLGAVVTAGFRFDLSSRLSLTPALGGGFGAAFTSSDWSSEIGGQAFAVARVDLAWAFRDDWQLDLKLGYRGIGEASAWYSGAEIALGIGWKLKRLDWNGSSAVEIRAVAP
jgi:hypothetical protein